MSEPSVVEQAAELAHERADAAGVELVDLTAPDQLRQATRVLDEVWGRADGASVMPPEALTALAHAGGQVSGAFDGERLVGATAAFVGLGVDEGPHLHSHVTGVVASHAGRGVGLALKCNQRAWALARGIRQVRWTFDPLIRRNLAFNLVALGARAEAFEHDVYGPMDDARNAGLPTDRLVVAWDLAGPRTRAALTGRAPQPDVAALRRAGAQVVLEPDDAGAPVVTAADAPRRLVRVPDDVERLRAEDPELARRWSEALRETLGAGMRAGMRVGGATRDGWIVLAAAPRVEELA